MKSLSNSDRPARLLRVLKRYPQSKTCGYSWSWQCENGEESSQRWKRHSLLKPSPMQTMPTTPSICSPFLSIHHPKLSSLHSSFRRNPAKIQRPHTSYPCIKALDLDQNTLVAISVGVVSVAVGIGIPVFYETQIDNAAKRENTQPCFPCNGSGAQKCRFCTGTGSVTVELGGGENEVSRCINCDGEGTLTCTTCQGTGIQPRYLDRREFKDDD